jgi:hypothetical protein
VRLARFIAVACGIAVLAVAGCSSKIKPGQASPAPSSVPAPTSSVPAIVNPLDTNKLQADPCSGLTAAQLAPYMGPIRTVERADADNGPGCNWFQEDGHLAGASMHVYPKLAGVNGLYDSGSFFPYFERAGLVGGYPATHSAQGTGPQTSGDCETTVAVAEHGIFGVYVTASNPAYAHYKDMCTVSDALVVAAIDNLKKAGG